WIDYQSAHRLYATLLTPKKYSRFCGQFSLVNLTRFLEAFAYFSPAHAYSLHTTFLGLFPILMSSNEKLKKEAIARLEDGALFAFGVSEQAHGSDLFANEFAVRKTPDGWTADGAKFYIGNANAAFIISILAKKVEAASAGNPAKRAPFVLFALRPRESSAFQNVQKIRTLGIRSAFVGGFEVRDHKFSDADVISTGRDAWDAVLGTVNLGKYFLGFGATGICAHALTEAVDHLQKRILYGKSVVEMTHIRTAIAVAFARLCAMKFFAFRALDYLQVSCDDDRRYLLFNAVQKAKVSTEGVKVMGLLSECIGAKGFETDTYFESAIRDSLLIPSLEGSTHINYGLIAQFMENYFSGAGHDLRAPDSLVMQDDDPGEHPYWFEARDRNAKTVSFGDCLQAYEPLRELANVKLFIAQVEGFREFAVAGTSMLNPTSDIGLAIAIGKCFAIVAYGQLVAENCRIANIPLPTVSLIFHGLVEDMSAESLRLSAMFPSDGAQQTQLRNVVQVPRTSASDMAAVSDFLMARYAK
ncbi:MAG: acyl-CoA dehydrogenase, partial [Planctomycetes bacterium]|nr:acyl-CoA dehydrogenase [Planctomycetota bacterium]